MCDKIEAITWRMAEGYGYTIDEAKTDIYTLLEEIDRREESNHKENETMKNLLPREVVMSAHTKILAFYASESRLHIAAKQYSKMTDLMAEWVADLHDIEKENRLIEYQDNIGWPWKASQEQIKGWNTSFITWSTYFK